MKGTRFEPAIEKFRAERAIFRRMGVELEGRPLSSHDVRIGLSNLRRVVDNLDGVTLTHYTDARTAASIIGEGNLWVADVRRMRDETELHHASKHLFLRCVSLYAIRPGVESLVLKDILKLVGNPTKWEETELFDGKLVLAHSVCRDHDDALMWEAYGKRGTGVAIRYNGEAFRTMAHWAATSKGIGEDGQMGVTAVCYSGEDCQCLDRLVLETAATYVVLQTAGERDLVRTLLHYEVLRLLVSHKDPKFRSEKEYRLYKLIPTTTPDGRGIRPRKHVGSKSFHYESIFLPNQAIDLEETEFWKGLVNAITLGPCIEPTDAAAISAAAAHRGLSDRVGPSKLKLRC